MFGYPDKRYFFPKRTDDLIERAKPFIGKEITIRGWHQNISMRESYPNDETVGFVEEFYGDIPESELLRYKPKEEQGHAKK